MLLFRSFLRASYWLIAVLLFGLSEVWLKLGPGIYLTKNDTSYLSFILDCIFLVFIISLVVSLTADYFLNPSFRNNIIPREIIFGVFVLFPLLIVGWSCYMFGLLYGKGINEVLNNAITHQIAIFVAGCVYCLFVKTFQFFIIEQG